MTRRYHYKFKLFLACTLLILAGVFAFTRPAATKSKTYRIASSPDGSSLVLRSGKSTLKVKLIGIDASLSPNRGSAKEYLNSLAGKKVTLKKDTKLSNKTAAGQYLRYAYLGSTDLGLSLLKQGYAGEYQSKKYTKRSKYQKAAKKALSLASYDAVVLYLHGGSYQNPARAYHRNFLNELDSVASLQGRKLALILIDYPLAPASTYQTAYRYLATIYKTFRAQSKSLILAGDSAGGGLALGLAEYVKQSKLASPDGLVLISPWVDLTMKNPDIAKYTSTDTKLTLGGLRSAAAAWAGGASLDDYRLSPLYGNLEGLPKTLIFAGDQELLYPDIQLLANQLKSADVKTTFHLGASRQHIWPLYQASRSATAETIINFLK